MILTEIMNKEKMITEPHFRWEKTTDEFKKQEIDHYNSYFR